jgi:hypothetical protein
MARIFHMIPRYGAFALAFIMLSQPGISQSTTDSLDGIVRDTTGAVVLNAVVTVTDEDTGATQSTITNEGGTYAFKRLPAGKYRAAITANGLDALNAEPRI